VIVLTLALVCAMTSDPIPGDVDPMPAGRYVPSSKIEELAEVSSRARLVYLSLFPFADREGRVAGRPEIVKGMIAALDRELTAAKIGHALDELCQAGHAMIYYAENRTVLLFRGFVESQPATLYLSREAQSKYGPPPELDVANSGPTPATASLVPDGSPQTPLLNPPVSRSLELQGIGDAVAVKRVAVLKRDTGPTVAGAVRAIRRVNSGAELLDALKALLDSAQTFAPLRREDEDAAYSLVWFSYYMHRLGFLDDRLDDQREALIRRRYVECQRDGDMMLFVIDGTKRDAFRMGRDPKKGDDPRLRSVRSILKNFETMQELARKGGWKAGERHPVRARLESTLGTVSNG